MSCVYKESECIDRRNLLNAVNTKTLGIIKMNCIIKKLNAIKLFIIQCERFSVLDVFLTELIIAIICTSDLRIYQTSNNLRQHVVF